MDKEEYIITSEDIFDDNKFILDDGDLQRIESNIAFLKENDIPFMKHMRTIPINIGTKIKSEDEILNKLIIDYTLALFAAYSRDNNSKTITSAFNKIDSKLNVRRLLSADDIVLIDNILEKKLSEKELNNISSLIEEVAVYLWVLGFRDKPLSSKETDFSEINKIIFKAKNYLDILYKCKIKSKSEILEYADLIARYHYACRKYRMDGIKQEKLNEAVVSKQHDALNFITSYDLNVFMKDKLKVKCEKDDLIFSFDMPSKLSFIKANNNEFLSLSDNDKVKIIFCDMGSSNQYELELKSQKIERLYNSKGYKRINKGEIKCDNLKEYIKHIVYKKDDKAINVYLLYISNHIIKIESSIDKNINYENYDILLNSDNSNIDREILYSLIEEKKEEIPSTKELEINNSYDYSNLICNYSNINKIIEFSNSIYSRFEKLIINNSDVLRKLFFNGFEVLIINKDYKTLIFKTYDDYFYAFKEDFIKQVLSVTIDVNLSYQKDDIEYNNVFKIIIKPYDIKFCRLSDHDELTMTQIEESFRRLLDRLPKEESIFL